MYFNESLLFVYLALATLLVVASAGSVSPSCAPNITEPNVPLLRLGGVDLSRNCELAITPLLHRCHLDYFESVRSVFVQAKCYEGSESVRKAMCCSLWEAKSCMIRAASQLVECEGNTTDLYRALPSTKEDREHLLDQCSEYQEGVAACEVELRASFSFGVFVTILLVFISLPAIAFGAMKAHEFYQDYKKFKFEEAQRQHEQQIGALSHLEDDDALPLKEKTANYHDEELNDNELKDDK